MTGSQQQVHSPVTPTVRSIFWTPFSIQGSVMSGTQSKVFENCDGEVGLLSGALASEYQRAFPKEGPFGFSG